MKIKNYLVWAFLGLGFLTSCSSDDDNSSNPEEPGYYAGGYYVLNEGVFGSGNASVSYVNLDQGQVLRNVYGQANDGAALGDVGQSIAFHGDYAFVVVNFSGTVEVVDRETFEHVATIDEGLTSPRYIAFIGDKAYVSDWGEGINTQDDVIAVVDLETFQVVDEIVVPEGPEAIVAHDGKLYVNFIGGHNFNNKMGVIRPEISNIQEYQVGIMPNSLEIEDGTVWVAAGGYPNYTGQESAGKIIQFDLTTMEVIREYEFPQVSDHPNNLVVENGQVYYAKGTEIYSFSTNATELPDDPLMQLSEVSVLRSMEVYGEYLFVTSASSDFTGNGKLLVYDLATTALMESFEVGINPHGIYRDE